MALRRFLVNWDKFSNNIYPSRSIVRVFEGSLYREGLEGILVRWAECDKNKQGYIVAQHGGSEARTAIDPVFALKALTRCPDVVRKTCYLTKTGLTVIRYDNIKDPVKNSDYQPLTVAEIETLSDISLLDRPSWLGVEVTNDHRYSDAFLILNCKMVPA